MGVEMQSPNGRLSAVTDNGNHGSSSATDSMRDDSALGRDLQSTPPPGFPGGLTSPSSGVFGDRVSLYDAEALRSSGALSAPPPPGFHPGPVERTRQANQLLWADQADGAYSVSETTGFNGSSRVVKNTRTTSFTNLAAVLGTGLAESMDDSTRDQRAAVEAADASHRSLTEMFDPAQDLSYARQSRHAASRLIGTASKSPTGAVGSGYGSNISGVLLGPISSRRTVSSGTSPSPLFSKKPAYDDAQPQSSMRQSFSNEDDPFIEYKPSEPPRQSAPLGMFSRTTGRGLPTKDLGVTVMEPVEVGRKSAPPQLQLFGDIVSYRQQQGGTPIGQQHDYELERNLQNMGMDDQRHSPFLDRSTGSSSGLDFSQHRAEAELMPFVWDVRGSEPSRALVILRASSLHIPDVRSTCEAFGVLESFRSDFADRGIVFFGYYDIRSAQYAALELRSCLKRLAPSDRDDRDIRVEYCVPLNSSSAQDESILLLSEVPPSIGEDFLSSILSSYGAVRSLHRRGVGHYGGISYVVEFHNVHDAKQALLELESTQPWGPDVIVEVGTRNPSDRKRGRELLALIGRWRHGYSNTRGATGEFRTQSASPAPSTAASDATPTHMAMSLRPDSTRPYETSRKGSASSTSSSPMVAAPDNGTYGQYQHSSNRVEPGDVASQSAHPHQTTQLVLGPDGRYSYVVVNHSAFPHGHAPHHVDPHTMRVVPSVLSSPHVVHGPHGAYVTTVPGPTTHHSPPTAQGQHAVHYWPLPTQAAVAPHQYHHVSGAPVLTTSPYVDGHNPPSYPGSASSAGPYYTHIVTTQTDSSGSGGSGTNPAMGMPRRSASIEDKDARHLMLDIEAVESGRDTRTSLMVRNIPNKYTQHMLLTEFTDSGHGPGKIDFFYLPIDFKNRCNRGYAFVNFVDYRDIVPFHRQYFGQHWRVFNSDKICDITYARIQGKAGMLKRFENSALMEKDDEYKPLVFVSHGTEKGQRVPFP